MVYHHIGKMVSMVKAIHIALYKLGWLWGSQLWGVLGCSSKHTFQKIGPIEVNATYF